MADFAELARQYQVQDYGNPFMGTDMTEDGNVKLQSDSVTNQPEPVVAPAPVNPYEQQAEQLAMGVPTAGTPFTNPVPEQPAAPVAPDQMMAEQPQDEMAALKPGQVAPAQPQDYNAYIASQESGANPNVGYHYPADAQGKRKSTAYGTYGITAPAYRDIQMADPYFRGKDITTLSQEEQARANTTYRNVQSGQLKTLGLEPTEENIRGAQLLGAGGLKRYLDTGTFSNQAARANGGAQNLENILKGRMAGGNAPASQPNLPPQPAPAPEAATQPAPAPAAPAQQPQAAPAQQPGQPYQDSNGMYYDAMGNPVGMDQKHAQNVSLLQTQQNDPAAMATLAYDKSADPALRRVAAVQLRTQLENESLIEKARETLQSAATNPTAARKLSRALGSDEGSWLKFLFYNAVGANDLAKSEQIKLGAGDHWSQSYLMGKDGSQQAVWIKYNGQGAPVEGYGAEGQLAQDQVLAATSLKGYTAHTGKMKDRVTGEVYYEQTGPQGTRLVGPTGKVFSGDTRNLSPFGIGSDIEMKGRLQIQELNNKLALEPNIEAKKSYAKQIMEIAAKNETGDGSATAQGLEAINRYGLGKDSQGNIVEIQGGAPAAPAQATPAQAAPTQAAPAAPTQAAPAAPTQAVSGAPDVTQSTIDALKSQILGPKKQRGESQAAYEQRQSKEKELEKAVVSLQTKVAEADIALSKEGPKVEAKALAELKVAQPAKDSAANLTLQTLNDVLTHPGFKDVIGWPVAISEKRAAIPGDARNFMSKYNQLKGQQFLQAFQTLKGGGSITEKEGAKAESAIAALSDPGITESEFKRNAKILEDTIKNGINNQHKQLGLPPVDWANPSAGAAGPATKRYNPKTRQFEEIK